MVTLLLMRHAQAEPPVTGDRSRPLSIQGRQQATFAGQRLLSEGLVPKLVISSDSLRTRQTWKLVNQVLATGEEYDEPSVTFSEDIYSGGIAEIVNLVADSALAEGVILVVGHEPVISATAARLAGPDSDPGLVNRVRVGVGTASVSRLELADLSSLHTDQGRGVATLVAHHTAP